MKNWLVRWCGAGLGSLLLTGCAGAAVQTVPFIPPRNACVKVVMMDFWTSWVAGACFDADGRPIDHMSAGTGAPPVDLVETAVSTAIFNAWAIPLVTK